MDYNVCAILLNIDVESIYDSLNSLHLPFVIYKILSDVTAF